MKKSINSLSIKSKLYIAFALVVIIPTFVTSFLTNMLINDFENFMTLAEYQKFNFSEKSIIAKLKNNPDILTDYETNGEEIDSLLKENHIRMRVLDKKGKLLFDSAKNNIFFRDNPNYTYKSETKIFMEKYRYYKVILYSAEFSYDSKSFVKGCMLFIQAIGISILIVMIILCTRIISKGILNPIEELKEAIEEMKNGNLDFDINCKMDNEIGRFIKAFDDMRIRLRESLEYQERIREERVKMFANISHDIRTPVTCISGYVEALKKGVAKDEKTFNRYLNVIESKTQSIVRFVEDLFNLSRMEAENFNMDFKEHDSREMLQKIFSEIQLDFFKGGIRILKQGEFVERKIIADACRIQQVVENIVGNARRHVGDEGIIKMGAYVEGEGHISVFVEDDGEGIADEDIPFIFESFYRVEKSRSRNCGGAGLGLSICKKIVKGHNGKIWVESRKGHGSRFTFTLPVANLQIDRSQA